MIAELRDPEHLRSLGAAELSPELIAAVQRTAFARRIMVLELLRREYRSVTDQTSATVVRLIEAGVDVLVVTVIEIAPRGDAYRNL